MPADHCHQRPNPPASCALALWLWLKFPSSITAHRLTDMEETSLHKSPASSYVGGGNEAAWLAARGTRIGVPGAKVRLDPTASVFRWRGTSWRLALFSYSTYLHVILLGGLMQLLWFLKRTYGNTDYLRGIEGYLVQEHLITALLILFAVIMATFIACVTQRNGQRMASATETVESASQVTLQSAVYLRGAKDQAARLVRYTHLLLHLYYLCLDAPMTHENWSLLKRRRLLTLDERRELQSLAVPHAAVFVWALDILHYETQVSRTLSGEHAGRLEAGIATVKCLASAQQHLHEASMPLPFSHFLSLLSHVICALLSWNVAFRTVHAMTALLDCETDQSCNPNAGLYDGINGAAVVAAVAGDVLGPLVTILMVNTLRAVAVSMANPFGAGQTDYEFDYDLRRLWQEAQETLVRMVDDADHLAETQHLPRDNGLAFDEPERSPHHSNCVSSSAIVASDADASDAALSFPDTGRSQSKWGLARDANWSPKALPPPAATSGRRDRRVSERRPSERVRPANGYCGPARLASSARLGLNGDLEPGRGGQGQPKAEHRRRNSRGGHQEGAAEAEAVSTSQPGTIQRMNALLNDTAGEDEDDEEEDDELRAAGRCTVGEPDTMRFII